MADWYTRTVLTIIAACLLFLAGREAEAPALNSELSRILKPLDDIVKRLDDINASIYDRGEAIQKVAICDVWSNNNNNCVVLRSKTSPTGPVLPVESEPRVNVVR